MKTWQKIFAGIISGAAAILFVIFLYRRRRRQLTIIPTSQTTTTQVTQPQTTAQTSSFHASIAKLQRSIKSHSTKTWSQRSVPPPPTEFSWSDHQNLAVEAVETGWARFAFTHQSSAPASKNRATLWSVRDGVAPRDAVDTEWELPLGSSEFMQTLRINPWTSRRSSGVVAGDTGDANVCSVRMCLPLPGPPLFDASFPQEAYFEITIMYIKMQRRFSLRRSTKRSRMFHGGEGDEVKLIDELNYSISKGRHASLRDVPINDIAVEKMNGGEGEGKKGMVSIGLTTGGFLPGKKFSGTYRGSIGFISDGSVYLDGTKLAFESEKRGWGEVNKVIGCGFEPRKKRVFFTVDSHLVHSITCNSDAYKAPLFPIVAASCDVILQVNLGQGKFRYQPANSRRTPNPCLVRSGSTGSESSNMSCDSRELFSVGRMFPNGKTNNVNYVDTDTDVESDLFEISLHI